MGVGAARLYRRSQLRVGAEADREPTAVRRTKKMKNQRTLEHGIVASRSSGLVEFSGSQELRVRFFARDTRWSCL